MKDEIASRYAEALYSIASDENNIIALQEEVVALLDLLKDNEDFINLLSNSFITNEERIKIVDKTLYSFNPNLINLVKVVINNNRVNKLINVLENYNDLANAYRGVKSGLVYSAFSLTKDQIKQLETKISALENNEVTLKPLIDQNLIGGVKVVINGRIYDGSIKNKLEKMRLELLKLGGDNREN